MVPGEDERAGRGEVIRLRQGDRRGRGGGNGWWGGRVMGGGEHE